MSALPQRRVALLVEYDGTDFRGLQIQMQGERTVQGEIERAARQLGADDPDFEAAGRTDTGVHATGQVVAVSLPERLAAERVARSLNALLPDDICIRRAAVCAPDFRPRFDAIGRSYLYRLSAGTPPPPMFRRVVAECHYRLDPELTSAAAAAFRGQREMREWRSSICQATRTFLTIDEAEAQPPGADPWWNIQLRARSFLHHQVRFMVGGIVAVGSGRLPLGELQAALDAGRRPNLAKVEEARGLTLAAVEYPPEKNPFPPA